MKLGKFEDCLGDYSVMAKIDKGPKTKVFISVGGKYFDIDDMVFDTDGNIVLMAVPIWHHSKAKRS